MKKYILLVVILLTSCHSVDFKSKEIVTKSKDNVLDHIMICDDHFTIYDEIRMGAVCNMGGQENTIDIKLKKGFSSLSDEKFTLIKSFTLNEKPINKELLNKINNYFPENVTSISKPMISCDNENILLLLEHTDFETYSDKRRIFREKKRVFKINPLLNSLEYGEILLTETEL